MWASVVVAPGLVALWPVDPPGSGMEPVSPASAGRFFTTEPLGKCKILILVITTVIIRSRGNCL